MYWLVSFSSGSAVSFFKVPSFHRAHGARGIQGPTEPMGSVGPVGPIGPRAHRAHRAQGPAAAGPGQSTKSLENKSR